MSVHFAITALILLLVLPRGTVAHEFWIEPQQYQVESGQAVQADFKNGENFGGITLAYLERRTARYELMLNGVTSEVKGRMGDIPAFEVAQPSDGLLVVLHQTAPRAITYKTWEKFARFADHKDFADIRTRHTARALPDADFTESYTRYAKTLIGVGDAAGADAPTGLETEFVALANPYTDPLPRGLPVQLLYRKAPRANAQIEVFEKSSDGFTTITTLRTDSDGGAVIPVRAGHSYLLDAVVLRNAPDDEHAVWETLWAALTFAVPPR